MDLISRVKCAAEREAEATLLRLQRLAARDLQVQRTELNLRPAAFVTSSQTLSLHFGSALPSSILRGREYSVRLSVSNEFGLWSRDTSGDAIAAPGVLCEAIGIGNNSTGPKICVKGNTSMNVLGADGRVNFTFTLGDGMGIANEWVLLQFSLDRPLPSGRLVAPIVSLPLCVQDSPDSVDVTDTKSSLASRLQDVVAMCMKLCGQSIKIFDPLPSETRQTSDTSVHPSDLSPNQSLTSSAGLIYALECPGSLGIGGNYVSFT